MMIARVALVRIGRARSFPANSRGGILGDASSSERQEDEGAPRKQPIELNCEQRHTQTQATASAEETFFEDSCHRISRHLYGVHLTENTRRTDDLEPPSRSLPSSS